jgi:hypothetical protein
LPAAESEYPVKFKQPLPYTGIDGKTRIIRKLVDEEAGAIVSTISGVIIEGEIVIEDWNKDGTEFAKQLTGAWKDHMRLKPKLTADIPTGFKP